ncbi:mast/stem cell growth factor receptor Kit-like isoform X2 [Anopheles albimanus]|uniref:mast/stem cell growth factor receptor Kit-like isoform X2 n=1 Tax=Anopheles albimanus TaxID=7167 RepID=UPI00163F2FD0|nr:mast/stem cell growth factor receptor Kit-like isoform X2 [Anopheles albimanus]
MCIYYKNMNQLFITLIVWNAIKLSSTQHLHELSVTPIQNHRRYLQLHMKWNSTLPADAAYTITIEHIDTDTCQLEGMFDNLKHIKCAPILVHATSTDVIAPSDEDGLLKHSCPIQQRCTYAVLVDAWNYQSRIRQTVEIPDCVDDLCSCDYAVHLPAFEELTARVNRTSNQLVISWKPGTYNVANLPSNVIPQFIHIRVRRGTNNELSWGGLHTSMKEVTLPFDAISHCFDINELPGTKFVFLVQLKVIDSRKCERDAEPLKVTLPDNESLDQQKAERLLSPVVLFLVLISLVSSLVIGIMVVLCFKRVFKSRRNASWRDICVRTSGEHPPMIMSENELYVDMDVENARARGSADYLEVPHSALRIGREIGKGAFGRVFMASVSKLPNCNGPKIVAIKQLKRCPSADKLDEFLDEISMMKKVGQHPNIVALLGCCTIKQPLTMIMEYVGCGDLLEYLRKIRAKHLANIHQLEMSSKLEQQNLIQNTSNNMFNPMGKYLDLLHTSSSSDASYITQTDTSATRPSFTETTYTMLSGILPEGDSSSVRSQSSLEYVLDHKELHNFAKQIACGMEHLEDLGITHRDLAARNILIDERKTLKISDFGLSRTGIYINSVNKKVPLRWLSIEAIRDKLYSSKSDVWAFGIVLWEIGTLGGYPYPTIGNHEIQSFLEQGKRLERPENCTAEVYALMLQCWREDPAERPTFEQISKQLDPHKKIYIDFNDLEPTYVFPPTSDQLRMAIANNK